MSRSAAGATQTFVDFCKEQPLISAIIVVAVELLILAWLRWRFFQVGFVRALASVTLGGVIIAAISALLGSAG